MLLKRQGVSRDSPPRFDTFEGSRKGRRRRAAPPKSWVLPAARPAPSGGAGGASQVARGASHGNNHKQAPRGRNSESNRRPLGGDERTSYDRSAVPLLWVGGKVQSEILRSAPLRSE